MRDHEGRDGVMITLANGSEPLMWSVRPGGNSYRNYLGTVLAKWTLGVHPFVVWTMSSDDGDRWECGEGAYCDTLDQATEIFANRAKYSAGALDV